MKTTNLVLLSFFTLLGLAGCSGEHHFTNENLPSITADKSSYIQLNIQNPRSRTDDTYTVFEGDNKITNLYIYLQVYEEDVFKIVDSFYITGIEELNTHSVTLHTELPPKMYIIGVLVNADSKWINHVNKSNISDKISYSFAEMQAHKETGKFIMTNSSDREFYTPLKFVFLNYNTADNPLMVNIKVDRVFAAVGLKKSSVEGVAVTENIKVPQGYKLVATQYAPFNVRNHVIMYSPWLEYNGVFFLNLGASQESGYLNYIGDKDKLKDYGFQLAGKENSTIISENYGGAPQDENWTLNKKFSTGIYIRVDLVDKENEVVPFYVTTDANSTISIHPLGEKEKAPVPAEDTFKEGMYYSYFIQNTKYIEDCIPEYMIVRNNSYLVNLKKINNIGTKYVGEDLDDSNIVTRIAVDIEVNDWLDGSIYIDE